MQFIKMHGIGNDYVYVNGFEESVTDPVSLAPVIADRHTGVGGDGCDDDDDDDASDGYSDESFEDV